MKITDRIPAWARNLLFAAALFLVTLAMTALQKPLFLLRYASLAADASFGELAAVVGNGLRLDITVAGYTTALPILAAMLHVWVAGSWLRTLLKIYLPLAAAASAVAFALNLGLYGYWAFPLDGSILQFLATPKEAAASVTLAEWAGYTFAAAAYFAALQFCYSRTLRLLDTRRHEHRIVSTALLLLLAGLDFLAIRGGVTVTVANVSKVCFSNKQFLNHAATNPLFSFLSSVADGDRTDGYDFFDEEERSAIFDALNGGKPTENTDAHDTASAGRPVVSPDENPCAPVLSATVPPARKLLRTARPNIVFVLAESFGRSTVDETVGGVPVAPEFQRLKGEGISFENFIANSYRTDRGTVALLSGFPAQPKTSIMKMPAKAGKLPSVARSLRDGGGYTTLYFYGGDLNFTNTAAYLYATGFERLVWQKDMRLDAPTSKWGYADDAAGELFAEYVLAMTAATAVAPAKMSTTASSATVPAATAAAPTSAVSSTASEEATIAAAGTGTASSASDISPARPFFAVWQTLSSHEPFDVPTKRFEDRMLNSMAFADECIGRLVERLRHSDVWDNLLIIIVADHAYRYPYGIAGSTVSSHRIPMLWLGGAVARPLAVDTYASQTDLAATLLAQLGIPHDDFPFSRDIFDGNTPKFGYYCFNDGFGVVDADGATVYDCAAGRTITPDEKCEHGEAGDAADATAAERRLRDGKVLLQTTFKTIREL